jgi:hypothetical protein
MSINGYFQIQVTLTLVTLGLVTLGLGGLHRI